MRTGDLVDLRAERQRRGLAPIAPPALEPEPPPGLRRGDQVLLVWTGQTGTIIGHRWQRLGDRLALRLVVHTASFTAACGAEAVRPIATA